jgi:hypothetical protein
MNQNFYVYAHRRNDTGERFYIGKGHSNRAWVKDKRTKQWNDIVSKHGYTIEILATGLNEDQAFQKESEIVVFHGRLDNGTGILTNVTDGGRGISGYNHKEEAKEKIAVNSFNKTDQGKSLIKSRWTNEARANHAEITRQHFLSEERKKKQSDALKKYFSNDEAKEKLSQRQKVKMQDQSLRNAISESVKLAWQDPEKRAVFLAKNNTTETKLKRSLSAKNRAKIECPHCSLVGNISQMKRYHMDNCKMKGIV